MSSVALVSVPLSLQVNENSSTVSEQAEEQGVSAEVDSFALQSASSLSWNTTFCTVPSAGKVKFPWVP